MAERVGFEPTLEFPLNTLSKRAPSATRPSLRRRLGLTHYTGLNGAGDEAAWDNSKVAAANQLKVKIRNRKLTVNARNREPRAKSQEPNTTLAARGHAAAENAFKAIFVNHRSYRVFAFFVQ